jgi:tetratricopeptide (TPR) repeat protein
VAKGKQNKTNKHLYDDFTLRRMETMKLRNGPIGVITFIFSLALLLNIEAKQGNDILVPKDYPTINAAVKAAQTGGRIIITDLGVYTEPVVIDKNISLISNPPGARISASSVQLVAPSRVPPATVPKAPPQEGLVAHWKLDAADDDAVLDASGNGHNGTLRGNPVWQRDKGVLGDALALDGNDNVEITERADLGIRNAWTIAMFIKVKDFNKPYQMIMAQQSVWYLSRNNQKDSLIFKCIGLNPEYIRGNFNVNDGQWHHVAVVYGGGKLSLYIDGFLDNSISASGQISTGNQPVCLGKSLMSDSIDRSWIGLIDEALVYDRALNEKEVHELALRSNEGSRAYQRPNGLTIAKGANSVKLAGLIVDNCLGNGILIDPGENSSVDLTLSNTSILSNNGHGVFFRSGDNHALRLDKKCAISKNLEWGVKAKGKITINLLGSCELSDNGGYGLGITAHSIAADASLEQDPMIINIKESIISRNHNSGVAINSSIDYKISVVNSVLENNIDNGMLLTPSPGAQIQVDLEQTSLSNNGQRGLLASGTGKILLKAKGGCRFDENTMHGIEFYGPAWADLYGSSLSKNKKHGFFINSPSNLIDQELKDKFQVIVSNCSVEDNSGYGIDVEGEREAEISVSDSRIDNNSNHGLRIALSDQVNAKVDISGSSLSRNRHGFFVYGGSVALSAKDGCQFDENTISGVKANRPIKMDLSDSSLSRNQITGLNVVISAIVAERLDSENLSEISLTSCTLVSNKINGIDVQDMVNSTISAEYCAFDKNQTGINLAHNLGLNNIVTAANSTFNNNTVAGIVSMHPSKISLEECELSGNAKNGIHSIDSSEVSLMKCTVTKNGAAGLAFIWDYSNRNARSELEDLRSITLSECEILSNEGDGVLVYPAISSLLSVKGSTIEDNRCGIQQYHDSRFRGYPNHPNKVELVNTSIARNKMHGIHFMRTIELLLRDCEVSENSMDGLSLYNSHIDVLNSRLRPSFWADLASSNNNQRRSELALGTDVGVCSQVTLLNTKIMGNRECGLVINNDRLLLISNNGLAVGANVAQGRSGVMVSRRSIIQVDNLVIAENGLRNISADRLGGTLLSWELDEGVRENVSPADLFSSENKENEDERRIPLLLQRGALTTNFLEQAKAWQLLGKSEQSKRFLDLAQQLKASFNPADPQANDMLEKLDVAFKDTRKSLSEDSSGASLDRLIKLIDPESDSIQVATECLENRLSTFRKLIYLAMQLDDFPEASTEIAGQNPPGEVLHVYLDDLFELLSRSAEPETSMAHLTALCELHEASTANGSLLSYFSRKESAAAMNWLSNNANPIMSVPGKFSREYHNFMILQYKETGDSSRETEHLQLLAQVTGASDEAFTALDEQTELYLNQWNLPYKAIECQSEIIKLFPETEREFNARLKISKIHYEKTKDLPKAIFELTLLLDKMPEDYQIEPIRTLLGMAYLGNQDYEDARNEFAKVINVNQGAHRENCLYLMGYSYIIEQKYQEAIKPFENLINLYPGGDKAIKAKSFLDKIKKDDK